MASETPQYPIPYSSLTTTRSEGDTDKGTVNDFYVTASGTLSSNHRSPSTNHLSPSKRRRGSRTTSPAPKLNRKGSTGTPISCCTPTNSPEKLRSVQGSPGGGRSSRRLNKGSEGGGGWFQHHRVRAPGSPPTPYASSGRDKFCFSGDRKQEHNDNESGYSGISKLNISLSQAERTKEDLAAATIASGEKYTMQVQGTPGFFGSMEERQLRYKELNQMRIRNWERFYGDMDGQREGGGLRGSSVGRKSVGLRGGIPSGSEEDSGDRVKLKDEKRTGDDDNNDKGVGEGEKAVFVPVKFVLDNDA